jgi:hypothetical protein
MCVGPQKNYSKYVFAYEKNYTYIRTVTICMYVYKKKMLYTYRIK